MDFLGISNFLLGELLKEEKNKDLAVKCFDLISQRLSQRASPELQSFLHLKKDENTRSRVKEKLMMIIESQIVRQIMSKREDFIEHMEQSKISVDNQEISKPSDALFAFGNSIEEPPEAKLAYLTGRFSISQMPQFITRMSEEDICNDETVISVFKSRKYGVLQVSTEGNILYEVFSNNEIKKILNNSLQVRLINDQFIVSSNQDLYFYTNEETEIRDNLVLLFGNTLLEAEELNKEIIKLNIVNPNGQRVPLNMRKNDIRAIGRQTEEDGNFLFAQRIEEQHQETYIITTTDSKVMFKEIHSSNGFWYKKTQVAQSLSQIQTIRMNNIVAEITIK